MIEGPAFEFDKLEILTVRKSDETTRPSSRAPRGFAQSGSIPGHPIFEVGTRRPGKDVGFNGLEIALDDTATHGYHDAGALYDLVAPTKNALKPVGEWNHLVITCDQQRISAELNGEKVMQTDLAQFKEPYLRPDGSMHKFDIAYKDHPLKGYLGLQDHGAPCWYKNIKLKPLK